jgi:hypothetical protein
MGDLMGESAAAARSRNQLPGHTSSRLWVTRQYVNVNSDGVVWPQREPSVQHTVVRLRQHAPLTK